jgi:hypothetical protein
MSVVFAPLSAAHVAYRQRLDEQERRSARIKLLLRKDFLHRICFCSYVYGEPCCGVSCRMRAVVLPCERMLQWLSAMPVLGRNRACDYCSSTSNCLQDNRLRGLLICLLTRTFA